MAENSLRELAAVFLRLGITAFGGPAVHIALMEEEFVRRRKWLDRAEFLDLLAASNLIPGPSSTELAIYIGHRRAGARGLLAAGVCFILPAALITLACAWGYRHFGTIPRVAGALQYVKAAVVAVVLQALVNLGKSAVKSKLLAALGALAALAAYFGVSPFFVLFGAGLIALASHRSSPPVLGAGPLSLFLVFAKIGAVLFGSGYVLLAFLRSDLVEQRHWLTDAELLDAVSVGQITPGPVFTTATFIGYLCGGVAGAGAATLGIFLPAFLLVAASSRFLPRIRASARARTFLDGVNVAGLALMAVVTLNLGRASVTSPSTAAVALGAAALALWKKASSTWLILGAAAIGVAAGLASV